MTAPVLQSGLRVSVDLDLGRGYAQCCSAAPRHVRIEGHEALFHDPAPALADRADIERVRVACPVQAIRVEDRGHEGASNER